MKTNIKITSILTGVLLLTACQTSSPSEQALAQLAVTSGCAIGTADILAKSPQYRPDFILGSQILNTISTGTNTISVSSIESLMTQSGETNQLVDTLVVTGVAAATSWINDSTTNSVTQNTELKLVCGWISSGITEGVGSLTTTLKAKYHVK